MSRPTAPNPAQPPRTDTKPISVLILLFALLTTTTTCQLPNYGLDISIPDDTTVSAPEDCDRLEGPTATFAIVGDYGTQRQATADVAALVHSWTPDFIVTTGDNNYPDGAAATIDANIGQYYSDYIHPYRGTFGPGADQNRFFPALGNHDWRAPGAQPYLGYFTLPGNERYYHVRRGPVHLFILDSNEEEPDGITVASQQAHWLQEQLQASTAPWRLVILHHPPFTSALKRRSNPMLQWPFADWGAHAVISGHDHVYERLTVDTIPYIINGAGGKQLYRIGPPEPNSRARYNADHGAMLVHARPDCINFSFYNRAAERIDSITILARAAAISH